MTQLLEDLRAVRELLAKPVQALTVWAFVQSLMEADCAELMAAGGTVRGDAMTEAIGALQAPPSGTVLGLHGVLTVLDAAIERVEKESGNGRLI